MVTHFLEESGCVMIWNQDGDNCALLKESRIICNYVKDDTPVNIKGSDLLGSSLTVNHGISKSIEEYTHITGYIITGII